MPFRAHPTDDYDPAPRSCYCEHLVALVDPANSVTFSCKQPIMFAGATAEVKNRSTVWNVLLEQIMDEVYLARVVLIVIK